MQEAEAPRSTSVRDLSPFTVHARSVYPPPRFVRPRFDRATRLRQQAADRPAGSATIPSPAAHAHHGPPASLTDNHRLRPIMRLPVSRRQQALLASLGCTALLLLGIAHTQGRLPARPVSAGSRSWKQWAWRETAGGSNFTWHRPLFYEGREGLVGGSCGVNHQLRHGADGPCPYKTRSTRAIGTCFPGHLSASRTSS